MPTIVSPQYRSITNYWSFGVQFLDPVTGQPRAITPDLKPQANFYQAYVQAPALVLTVANGLATVTDAANGKVTFLVPQDVAGRAVAQQAPLPSPSVFYKPTYPTRLEFELVDSIGPQTCGVIPIAPYDPRTVDPGQIPGPSVTVAFAGPAGPQGLDGPPGQQGPSAYDSYVANGGTLSEAQWSEPASTTNGLPPLPAGALGQEGASFVLRIVGGQPVWVLIGAAIPVQAAGAVGARGVLSGSVTVGPAPVGIQAAGVVLGSGSLSGAASITSAVQASGVILSSAALSGAGTAVGAVAASGGVPPSAALSGAATVVVSAAGSVAGQGTLSGAAISVPGVAASGMIPAGGTLSGAASSAGTYAGTVPGQGTLTGAASVAVAANGNVPGQAALGGSATVVNPVAASGAVSPPSGPQGSATVAAPQGLVQTRKGRLAAAMAA